MPAAVVEKSGRPLLAACPLFEPAAAGLIHLAEFSWCGELARGRFTTALQRNAGLREGLRLRNGRGKKFNGFRFGFGEGGDGHDGSVGGFVVGGAWL